MVSRPPSALRMCPAQRPGARARLVAALAATVAMSTLLGGCATRSAPPPPASRPALPAAYAPPLDATATAAAAKQWWAQLRDPQLDALIERALSSNRDLKTAAFRIAEARALAAAADARAQPQISFGGYVGRDRQSDTGRFGSLSSNPVTERQLGFDASWEIDAFGAIGRRREAARADVQAAAAQRGAIAVSVAAEVAATYIELRTAQALHATLNDLMEAASGIEQLVAGRERAGLATALDRLRAAEQVSLTAAALPLAQQRAQTAARRLGVLVGGHTQTLLASLSEREPLPVALPGLPSAVPAALLDRRPDIVAAEAHWSAARARLAAAEADRLPRVTLGSALGLLSISQGRLFDAASAAWSIAAALRLPIYVPQLDAAVDAERARAEQAALAYESAAVQAMLEVEQAVVRLHRAEERLAKLDAALAADVQALDLARIRYERGLTDFIAVLDVVRSRSQVEQQWVEARAQVFVEFIALNKALGGGWELGPVPPVAAAVTTTLSPTARVAPSL